MTDPQTAADAKAEREGKRTDAGPEAPPIRPYPKADDLADPENENQRYRLPEDRDDVTTPEEVNPPAP